MDWLSQFNGMSNSLGLLYAKRLENRVYCKIMFKFLLVVPSEFFFTQSYIEYPQYKYFADSCIVSSISIKY